MRSSVKPALLCSLLASAVALAGTCPTRPSWPTKGWPENKLDPTAKADALKALEDYAFTLQGKDSERLGLRTDGLVIVKSGAIVYERYGRGFGPNNRHISWSVAKSITSALAGVAVMKGALSLDDSICTYLTEYQGQDICKVKVKHPLTFTSGIRWQEAYENESYQVSSIISMLFGVGHRDYLAHIFGPGLAHEPGSQWMYSSGDATVEAAVVKRALEKDYGKDAFWTLLFDKLGVDATFEEDLKGTPGGGMLVYATPRDFAKLGYLFLNDGCWAGERLEPEGWVKASTTPSDGFVASAPDSEDTPSGYSWWLNAAIPSRNKPKPWPDAPDDTYLADGHWGQTIIVIPSEDLVIVRTGDDRNGKMSFNTLVKLTLEVLR